MESYGSILERAIAVEVYIGKLGVRRKVTAGRIRVTDTDEEQIAADQPEEEMLHVTKEILRCPEYEAIRASDSELQRTLKGLALPSMMARGVYLIPLDLVERADEILTKYKAARKDLIELFIGTYETAQEAAATRLGTLHDAADYPPPAAVRASFKVRVRYRTFNVPEKLQTISASIFAREKQRAADETQQAADALRGYMREAFADLVAHMADRLTPSPDGKSKTFKGSTIKGLMDFLDTFAARNIADDADLAEQVARAKELLGGVDPDALRKEPVTKMRVTAGILGIKAALDKMVVTTGRKFAWNKEPEIGAQVPLPVPQSQEVMP